MKQGPDLSDSSFSEALAEEQEERRLSSPFDVFYRRTFTQLVKRLSRTYGAGPPEPEEVAQRAFERIMIHDNLADLENKEAYIWRVAKNIRFSDIRAQQVRDNHKEAAERTLQEEKSYQNSAENVFLAKDALFRAQQKIHAMPDERRKAFELVRISGHTHQQAAELLGISRPAVSKHVARAHADLYRVLKGAL